ncbi:MAG: nodulation protein NfeD [Chloroflexi bacterium]|nr:nodulation protein NfeD [Chloroflexota bacterium]MCL5074691.1 nodulation protein NfeD [Chloroflexota bacterium]
MRAIPLISKSLLLALFLWGVTLGMAWANGPRIDLVTIKGVIDPLTAQYLCRAIDKAEQTGAECLIIQLDTPGGLDTSMRAMMQKMLNSTVPVIVYVYPSGARAASAGMFITLAADVAAMAPGTNIGAAHPVSVGEQVDKTMTEKVTSDAAATARAIAVRRGRNAAWAEKAVRESASITDKEALENGVIDLIAVNLADLSAKLDERTVVTAGGERTLRTREAAIVPTPMSLPETLLHTIVDPNIAYLLLTIGIWAIIAEFYHPGAIIPGITGVICLILAFVAFESLPLNWGGLALVIVSMILFIVDLKSPSHGVLTGGGIIAFILGSLMLFSPLTPMAPTMPEIRVSWWLITAMTAAVSAFFIFALGAGLRAQRVRPTSGVESLVGMTGIAISDLDPTGIVQVQSEEWSATTSGEMIKAGERVQVVAVDGLRLRVCRSA